MIFASIYLIIDLFLLQAEEHKVATNNRHSTLHSDIDNLLN